MGGMTKSCTGSIVRNGDLKTETTWLKLRFSLRSLQFMERGIPIQTDYMRDIFYREMT